MTFWKCCHIFNIWSTLIKFYTPYHGTLSIIHTKLRIDIFEINKCMKESVDCHFSPQIMTISLPFSCHFWPNTKIGYIWKRAANFPIFNLYTWDFDRLQVKECSIGMPKIVFIKLLEKILLEKVWVAFFLGHPVYCYSIFWLLLCVWLWILI